MDFFDKDLYQKGLEFQKKMTEQYMEGLKNYGTFFAGAAGGETAKSWTDAFDLEKMQKSAEEMIKATTEVSAGVMESYKNAAEMWRKAITQPGVFQAADYAPFMDRMTFSMDIYNKLFDFWKDFTEAASKTPYDPAKAAEKYMKLSEDMVRDLAENFSRPFTSEDLASLSGAWQDLGKTFYTSFNDFMEPWTTRQEAFTEAYFKAAQGDKDGITGFMDLLQKAYEESYGKVFRMNSVGLNRENTALVMQFLDSYVRMLLSSLEITAKVQTVLRDAGTDLYGQVRELVENEEKSFTFKDFYDMWIRVNSAAINNLYNTDEFSSFLNVYSDNAYDFKAKYDEFMEKMLSGLPIPTNSEMKDVYKTVYDLRKDVRKLKKEIKELQKELDAVKNHTEA